MKNIITMLCLSITMVGLSQSKYEVGMQKAFQLWGEGNPAEAVNLFERIATAEPENWLPLYHAAQVSTVVSFGEKDKEKLSAQLGKAQEFLDMAKVIMPNNAEILVQQAMIHTAWVAFDGATYGMTLSGKIAALYAKAAVLSPENPRVVFSKAEWDMGSARFFGKDTAPFCKDIERSLTLFANFKAESSFHPNWGKERAEQALKNCK